MRDFSLEMLKELLGAFRDEGFEFVPFETYWREKPRVDSLEKIVLLRHDVDRQPGTARAAAEMESSIGVRGTYFFRVKPWTMNPRVIEAIVKSGHEIGYHYENLADAGGNAAVAKELLEDCLRRLREYYPVVSVSMHSVVFSKWDGRKFWDDHDLAEFGLLGECYRSIDHFHYMYIADSGRNWNADRNVIWDFVQGTPPPLIENGTRGLVREIRTGRSIKKVQLLIHPNRWPASLAGEITQFAADEMINTVKTCIRTYKKILGRK
jgi:hypothetical protein